MKIPIAILNPKCASTSIRTTLKLKAPSDRTIHLSVRHPKIRALVKEAGDDAWTFMTVRHPLDRAISAFYFFKKKMRRTVPEFTMLEAVVTNQGINEFIRGCDMWKLSQVCPHFERQKWFQRGGDIDQILRMESLQEDFDKLCDNLGRERTSLPKRRKSKHGKWDEELDQYSVDKLVEWYLPDFELWYPDELGD